MLARRQLVVEGAGGVLDGADQQVVQQVPVGERRLVQRLSPAPAADQVDEPVDPAEALDQRRAPAARRVLVEQVDRAPVPALGRDRARRERVERLLVAVGPGDGRPGLGQPRRHQRPQPAADAGDRDHAAVKRVQAHAHILARCRRLARGETFCLQHMQSCVRCLSDQDIQPGQHRRARAVNRRVQGDLGEFSAMEWLASKGAPIWIPIGHSPDVDLMAELDGGDLIRIQVKTSTLCRPTPDGQPPLADAAIATSGGNRSWSGVAKKFDLTRVEYLFALVGDGRRWFISGARGQRRSSSGQLGGAKYSRVRGRARHPDSRR